MKQITAKTLRDANWKQVYAYDGISIAFKTFACDAIPGFTITKEQRGKGRVKITTTYAVNGRKTESPTQAVRYFNEEAKRQAGIGQPLAGSAEQIRQSRRDAGL